MTTVETALEEAVCAECHGQGGWEEDHLEFGCEHTTVWVDCPKCDGKGKKSESAP